MKSVQITTEVLFFGGIVVAAHLALVSPEFDTGLESAGDAGADLLQVMTSNASLSAIIEAWDRPPVVAVVADMQPPEMPAPPADAAAPAEVGVIPLSVHAPDGPPLPMAPALSPAAPRSPAAPTPPKPPASPTPPDVSQPVPQKPEPQKSQAKPMPVLNQMDKDKPVAKSAAIDSLQRTARRADGQGGNVAKGKAGQEATATVSDSKRNSLLGKWGQQIRSHIAQRAPKGVGKGRAIVRITVSSTGVVSSVRMAKSSGNAKLDQQALKAVRSAGRMPRAPKGLNISAQTMDIPLSSR